MCALEVGIVKRRNGTLKVVVGLKLNHSAMSLVCIFKITRGRSGSDVPTTIAVTADLGEDDVDIGPACEVFEILGRREQFV